MAVSAGPIVSESKTVVPSMVTNAVADLKKIHDVSAIRAASDIIQKCALLHPRCAAQLFHPSVGLGPIIRPLLSAPSTADPSIPTAGAAIVSAISFNQWTTEKKDLQPYFARLYGESLVRLLSHPHSTVQAEAARALWNMSYLSQGAQEILGSVSKCIPPLIELIKWPFCSHETVIVYAAEALGSLTYNNPKVQELALASDALRHLTKLLDHSDQFVQLASLSALPSLFTCVPNERTFTNGVDRYIREDIQNKFANEPLNGLAALVKVLKKSNKPDILAKACEVVYHACFMNPHTQSTFVTLGGSKHVLDQLPHTAFPELQRAACLATMSVMFQSQPSLQKAFIDNRALELLHPILRAGVENPSPVQFLPALLALLTDLIIECETAWRRHMRCLRSHGGYIVSLSVHHRTYGWHFQNLSVQKWICEKKIIQLFLGWLPLGEVAWKGYSSGRLREKYLKTYKLALRCLAEILSPESIQTEINEVKLVSSRRADNAIQREVWSAIGLTKFWTFFSDQELAAPALLLFGHCAVQNPQVHEDLVHSPHLAKLFDKITGLMRNREQEQKEAKGESPTAWTPLTLTMSLSAAATVCICHVVQDQPQLVAALLRQPTAVEIIRASVKRADYIGRTLAQQQIMTSHLAVSQREKRKRDEASTLSDSSGGSVSRQRTSDSMPPIQTLSTSTITHTPILLSVPQPAFGSSSATTDVSSSSSFSG